ncbi:hypothetical protein MF428_005049 [Salmonella enterica]|nr:hypothetical protein [Salmonella enterica]
MTTINKERIELFIKNPLENGLTRGEQMELARIALASLDAEPVVYNQVQRYMMRDIIIRKMGGNLAGEKLVMDDIHAVTMALIDAGFRAFPPAPVVPDDWVMVPKEPTQAMINAWLSEVADWRGHVAGYKAMLAAVPEKETRPCTK